jgi:hypothetical protein
MPRWRETRGAEINQDNLLRQSARQSKVQTPPIQVTAEYVPDTERMLRGLMLVLEVDRTEIERLLKERRERIDHTEGMAA